MWTTTLTRRRRAVPAVLLVAAAASAAAIMWRSSSSGVIVPMGAAMRPSTTVPEWFGRTDQAPRRIAGHVLVSGEPAIATVHVRLGLPDPRAWTGRDVLTDAAGAFDLGSLPAGPYQLLVTAPGVASRVYQVDTATTDGADLSLFAYACRPLSGRVVALDARDSSEAAGNGLAGATVEIGGVEVAATDHDGNYSFCGPGEGTEAVIRAPGRVSRWAWLDTVMPRPEHTALALEKVLRGRVVDQFGFGVGGVTVEPCMLAYTDDPPNEDMPALAVTNADGIFELHEVAMGRNIFRLSQRGLADDDPEPEAQPDGTVIVKLRDPWARRVGRCTVLGSWPPEPPVAWIRGHLVHAGHAVPDAQIVGEVDSPGDVIRRRDFARSRPDGTFELPLATTGLVHLSAELAPMGWAHQSNVVVDDGEIVDGVVLELAQPVEFGGEVVDERGAPIPDVAVSWRGNLGWRDEPKTDARGHFHFGRGLLPGRYRLTVFMNDRALAPPPGRIRATVDIPADGSPVPETRIVVQRKPPSISGVVVDVAGHPVSGARVELYDGNIVWTDATGRFEVSSYRDGTFTIIASTPDQRVAAMDDVAMGTTGVRLVVDRGGSVRLQCNAARAKGQWMTLYRGRQQYSDHCGTRIDDVVPGEYMLLANGPLLGDVSGAVVVRPGEVSDAAPTARGRVPLRGRVVEYPGGAPVVGLRCRASWPHVSMPDASMVSDAHGEFALGVLRGHLEVDCDDGRGRYVPSRVALDLGDAPATVEVRVVRVDPSAIDLGVDFSAEPDGARVTGVGDEAAAAGLQPGDLVTAASSASLAGLSGDAITELAFRRPRGTTVEWTVRRGGREQAVTVSLR